MSTCSTGQILFIPDLLTKEECQAIIDQTNLDLNDQLDVVTTSYSEYSRVYLYLPDLADKIWQQIGEQVKNHFQEPSLVKIKPTWASTKYLAPGGHLGPHIDGYNRGRGYKSRLTLNLYLNDQVEFSGGETYFYDSTKSNDREQEQLDPSFIQRPVVGAGVIFPQNLLHSGEPVTNGTKYILRTDFLAIDPKSNVDISQKLVKRFCFTKL